MSIRVFALIFTLVGALTMVLSVNTRPTVPAGWAVTQGTVVDYVESGGDSGTTRSAVVEYRAADGTTHRIVNSASFGLGLGEQLGDSMDVAYDPARPDQARLTSGSAAWGWLLGLAIGVLFALVGLFLLVSQMRAHVAVQAPATSAGTATAGGAVAISHVGGSGYVFRRAWTRIWLDVLIAPAIALMFAAMGWLLINAGGDPAIFGVVFIGAALLLIGFVVHDVRQGLFSPAAEVGAGGIWLRGAGRFSWDELAEVRHERFAAPAGEQGLAVYDRLGLVPHVEVRGRASGASGLMMGIANGYQRMVMPIAGRHPIEMAAIGLMGYEVADFDGLMSQVRHYVPVTEVSDEPEVSNQPEVSDEPEANATGLFDAIDAPAPDTPILVDASEI
jgi:Protein of unknown function (DUF3592)